jgi:sialate O-acetylesterase
MKRCFITVFVLVLWITSLSLNAQIKLPAVIGDNMVLQQKSEVAIWGWGEPGSEIKVTGSWNNDTVKTKITNHSFWSVKLKTPAAGGPFTVNLKSGEELTLKNVMIGEVWICSGQSNMEWSASHNLMNAEEEVKNANYPEIRLLHVKKVASNLPQENCFGKWEECSPATMKTFSSVGYFFSRNLYQSLKVPIGIIEVAWGGTPAEVWIRSELVNNDPLLKSCADRLKTYDWWPKEPGVSYNAMIAPLIPYNIAGAIWYQGEGNAESPESYRKLMATLVNNWRHDFGKDFPFYLVQIAPYAYGSASKAPIIREMQMQAVNDVPGTGMVVVSDLVDDIKNIHPRNKQDVGKRLANWALGENYGIQGLFYKHPEYESMKIEKSKVRITFKNVPSGLTVKGDKIETFEIAGADKKFVPANVKIDGKTVVVSSKEVKVPEAVRFSFSNAAIGNLFSSEGLPVAPFRTDNWE